MNAVDEYRKERARRGPDVDGLTADAAITELDDAKTAVLSRLDAAESEADRLRTLFQKAKNAMEQAEAALADMMEDARLYNVARKEALAERDEAWAALATEKAYSVGVEMAWQGTEIDSYREWLESAKDVEPQPASNTTTLGFRL